MFRHSKGNLKMTVTLERRISALIYRRKYVKFAYISVCS